MASPGGQDGWPTWSPGEPANVLVLDMDLVLDEPTVESDQNHGLAG
jgi:hypothetical protein